MFVIDAFEQHSAPEENLAQDTDPATQTQEITIV